MVRLDYDRIADLYDERARDHDVDLDLVAFLESRGDESSSGIRILDVGCGTGKQLAADYARWPSATLVGVDRSRRMLEIARKRCSAAAWIQADGAALPLTSASINYATSQFSYQHIGNTRTFLGELYRVLEAGGRFVMTNIDPWSMPGWLVYRYFPQAWTLDERDFTPVHRFVALLDDVGFRDVRVRSADLSRDEHLAELQAWASKRHSASQLMAIPDEAYTAGLAHIQRALRDAGDVRAVVKSEFVRVTIAADKPVSG